MIHVAATLYLIAIELLNMGRFIEGEDLQDLFRVAKDCHHITFIVDPWKDEEEQFRKPTKEYCTSLLQKIEDDLVTSAVDKLDKVREELDDALSRIYDF